MSEPRSGSESDRPEQSKPRARDGERLRLEHESTLSLDWETQHGSGSEAAGVDEVLRARNAQSDDPSDEFGDGLGPEPDIGLDRTMADPANATMRGIDSPLIAPKGSSSTAFTDSGRSGNRPNDEGFRFSGASMSYGQLVVVESRDFPTEGSSAVTGESGSAPEGASEPARGAVIILVALGLLLAVAGAVLLMQ